MDKLYLKVKTVPAFDTSSLQPHTSYTVYRDNDGSLQVASGWTLKDAIELFSRLYGCDITSLKITRPFIRQH